MSPGAGRCRPSDQRYPDGEEAAGLRRAGTRPRTDHTLETALATVRDLAVFLAGHQGKRDWALADVHDIEAFLATVPKSRKRRLTVLRQFFRFARTRKIILADPTQGPGRRRAPRLHRADHRPCPAARPVPPLDHQPRCAPARGAAGHLRLLHGASSSEVRHLRAEDIDGGARAIRLGKRPHPAPLDPASWQVLQRCLAHRETQRTVNPHVIITKGSKAGRAAASAAYISHVLDSSGVPPRMLRCTRLADLVNTMDPKLVAAAFGMNPEGVMIYLADHVDAGRLPADSGREPA